MTQYDTEINHKTKIHRLPLVNPLQLIKTFRKSYQLLDEVDREKHTGKVDKAKIIGFSCPLIWKCCQPVGHSEVHDGVRSSNVHTLVDVW